MVADMCIGSRLVVNRNYLAALLLCLMPAGAPLAQESAYSTVEPSALATLKKEGFVSVINLRLASEPGANVEAEEKAAQAAGLKYIALPFDAAAPDAAIVDRFLAAVATKANQPIFIHCGSANRVGGVWMIKRVLQDGWTIEYRAWFEGAPPLPQKVFARQGEASVRLVVDAWEP